MFLERFLIGNLWNAGLIFFMFGLKRLMQNRVSLRFQYYSWYVLIVSLLLPLFPSSIWNVWSFSAQNSSQTMATYNLSVNTVDMTHTTQWMEDVTQLMMESPQKLHFEFGVLVVWLIGVFALMGFYWCGSYRLRQVQHFAMSPEKEIQELFDGPIGKAQEYLLAMQALENFRLSTYGLENGGLFEKKAHKLEGEQEMNSSTVGLVYADGLAIRQNFCNIVNSIWGTSMWCMPAESVIGGDVDGDGDAFDNNTDGENSGIDTTSPAPNEGGND